MSALRALPALPAHPDDERPMAGFAAGFYRALGYEARAGAVMGRRPARG